MASRVRDFGLGLRVNDLELGFRELDLGLESKVRA